MISANGLPVRQGIVAGEASVQPICIRMGKVC